MIAGASWLISGGSGYFGQAFVRHVLHMATPRRVVVLSRSESRQAAMAQQLPDQRIRYVLGDVRDLPRLERAFQGVEYVVHAAAQKQVTSCERDPWEAVATNVVGTWNVVQACLTAGVHRAVFLSSDKAVAAHTTYGATKFVAERLWIQANVYAAGTATRFLATRYGNVAGSTGSVLEVWRNGRATITTADATRFWMRVEDACRLVLYALEHGQGGEVFIPKLKSATVGDLAETFAPGHTLPLTGLRGGEKLHELLLSEHEMPYARDCGSVYVLYPFDVSWMDAAIPKMGQPVHGLRYSSDTVERLTPEEVRGLVE